MSEVLMLFIFSGVVWWIFFLIWIWMGLRLVLK